MFPTDAADSGWKRVTGWCSLRVGLKEIPQSDEPLYGQERLWRALDPILHRVEEQLRRGPVWILADGPQGAGKTKTLGPTLKERIRALHGWTPEAVCTNLSLASRSRRRALSPIDYSNLWRWYRFDYLTTLVKDIIAAQRINQSSVTITHWYNRDREGIVDETPRVVPVFPLMILEGIGALSDDVVRIFGETGVPYVGLIVDAPQEDRYKALLATRTYRSKAEQLVLMDTVEGSYWEHFPAIRKNASYSIFVAGDDVCVTPIA